MSIKNPDPAHCPLCGDDNRCGQVAGAPACWCASVEIPAALLAQVPPAAQNKACICRNCVMAFQSQKYRTVGAPATEAGDFYMENGFVVFTEAYLRRRGYCCESGCRHCPYRKQVS